jgi:hypothetical protein
MWRFDQDGLKRTDQRNWQQGLLRSDCRGRNTAPNTLNNSSPAGYVIAVSREAVQATLVRLGRCLMMITQLPLGTCARSVAPDETAALLHHEYDPNIVASFQMKAGQRGQAQSTARREARDEKVCRRGLVPNV